MQPIAALRLIYSFGEDKMISVITPAHNEELFIKKCLCSVKAAAKEVSEEVEHVVVLNRCTDRTGEIAGEWGARVITDDSRNLSRIRNKGVEVSKGDILMTIDADSILLGTQWLFTGFLREIKNKRIGFIMMQGKPLPNQSTQPIAKKML
ncbi:MAG: glycosyl transferase group 2 family protein [Syntrophaceae bacterium]|nr:MAG: glycosyl transferase group 2 family protein [Syntrophaceae bacterium]